MNRRVVITGVGVVTPVGNEVEEFWNSLLAGRSGVDRISLFDPSNFSSQIAGEVKNFEPQKYFPPKELRRMERFTQFALYAGKKAWEDAGLNNKVPPERCGVLVGSGIGALDLVERQYKVFEEKGPGRISPFLIPLMIANMAAGQLAIYLGLKGPNMCVVTACASGTHSIGEAFRIIQNGKADIMVAGGAEACVTRLGVGGFCALRALSTRNDQPQKASRPFDKERDGFVIGEGAGIVVLEEYERARERGADIYAEIIGYGASCDAYHQTAPDPEGQGAYLAMKGAVEDAGINPEDIDYINAHGTSTQLNDKIETLAIKKLLKDHAYEIGVSSIKSMIGHLIGAAGGVEAVATALAVKNQVIPPTINYEYPDPDCDLDYVPNQAREAEVKYALSNSFGFGGHNACLVFKKV
ncbi:MAG: beta-ketoacyl-[acyl-carrier-protein] synthase II [Candidatus Omnitrophica bacterium 4484_49]|nr:MAG: beta-ketoacyl-[acyl-carrier-protein] synthase II [Candidatus Omnitrophica bacterium 4484_49]